MRVIEEARKLFRAGDFADALRLLERTIESHDDRADARVLKTLVLERLGRLGQAEAQARQVIASRNVQLRHRAWAEYVLGRVAFEKGLVDDALASFQKTESFSERTGDLACLFWSRISIVRIVSQRAGRNAATPILSQTRAVAIKVADPQITAALHSCIAEVDGKAGLVASAEQHATLALKLLAHSPNVSLEAATENIRVATALMRCEYESALAIGRSAAALARQSQSAASLRAALANIGNAHLVMGEYDEAAGYFEQAIAALPYEDDNNNGVIDGLARVRLAQRQYEECDRLLDSIDRSIHTAADRRLYGHRHSAITRIRLRLRQERYAEALDRAHALIGTAEECNDTLLLLQTQLKYAEALCYLNRCRDLFDALTKIGELLPSAPPDLYADYHRILALAFHNRGVVPQSEWHRRRASQIYLDFRNVAGFHEIEETVPIAHSMEPCALGDQRTYQMALQSVAELLLDWKDNRTIGRDLAGLLEACGYPTVHPHSEEIDSEAGSERPHERVATNRSTLTEAWSSGLRKDAIADSAAMLNSVTIFESTLQDLVSYRAAKRRKELIWHQEEISASDDFVIDGNMRELMTLADRVAKTKVLVLVVGESGTGKEIIARTVHDYSDRARKPFIPINCSAVPKHLLESTLFGHRRGAFTGADRDSPGLIRAAAGGTLFLDEIGELSLDLQPKLLRFLESGEIAPLGEPTTTRVDVRIVCATNRNLGDLVQEGRFREDLFYRINVVRLALKPLRERRDEIPNLANHFVARAAEEFGKGYLQVAEETMERLLLYRWPGNIRQLQNEIRRMVALVEPGATLQPEMISEEILAALPLLRPQKRRDEIAVSLQEKLPSAVARVETEMIKAALREHRGRVDAVAKALGISRKGLYLKRQRLGL